MAAHVPVMSVACDTMNIVTRCIVGCSRRRYVCYLLLIFVWFKAFLNGSNYFFKCTRLVEVLGWLTVARLSMVLTNWSAQPVFLRFRNAWETGGKSEVCVRQIEAE